jgi:hypothetical protein
VIAEALKLKAVPISIVIGQKNLGDAKAAAALTATISDDLIEHIALADLREDGGEGRRLNEMLAWLVGVEVRLSPCRLGMARDQPDHGHFLAPVFDAPTESGSFGLSVALGKNLEILEARLE